MVSPELLLRYPFFAGLNHEQVAGLARLTNELRPEPDSYLFYEGAPLSSLYLVLEGHVAISLSRPAVVSRAIIPPPGARTHEVTVSMLGVGDIFAWSSLVPPFKATSNARAASRCRVLAVQSGELRQLFELEPHFGYQVMVRVAQVARDRIQDLHYESLSIAVGAAAR